MRNLLAFVTTAAGKGWRAFREGRLPMSPARWLRDLSLHWGELAEHGIVERRARAASLEIARRQVGSDAHRELEQFLAGGARLSFTAPEPRVSVLLALHDRAELTLRALRSLALDRVPVELIVVDDGSRDRTPELLARLDGAHALRNENAQGFLESINQAAALAHSEYLLLLNSDAELLPGSLRAALAWLDAAPEVAALGGRLVLPDGTLQEAGSIIWRDGWCQGYGRGGNPHDAAYDFVRDVDFCSAACLLVRRADFAALGGFDPRYRPAYYEDANLCVRLWQRGRRVVYHPALLARHVEFASARSTADVAEQQRARHALFVAAHRDWLPRQPARGGSLLAARARPARGLRILFVDDRPPLPRFGSGHPRAAALVRALAAAGHSVSVFATAFPEAGELRGPGGVPPEVEVVPGGETELAATLRLRLPLIDRLVVSRPANLRRVKNALRTLGRWPSPVPIIYDAEAVSALRERGRAELGNAREDAALASNLESGRAKLGDQPNSPRLSGRPGGHGALAAEPGARRGDGALAAELGDQRGHGALAAELGDRRGDGALAAELGDQRGDSALAAEPGARRGDGALAAELGDQRGHGALAAELGDRRGDGALAAELGDRRGDGALAAELGDQRGDSALAAELGDRRGDSALAAELALALQASTVLSVSEAERQLFVQAGARRVLRLGDAVVAAPTTAPFAARAGVLFVGAFYEPESPNSDGIVWFVEQVWPRVRDALGSIPLRIAGPRPGRRVRALAGDGVEVLGAVDDLTPLFEQARVFVAPTRFAAGLPRKVLDAAARGVPVVATTLLARQLDWTGGDQLEAADTPDAFAAAVTLLHSDAAAWQARRERALERISRDYHPSAFAATLAEALAP